MGKSLYRLLTGIFCLIMGMLLLTFSVSCRQADTNEEITGDTNASDEELAKLLVGTWVHESKHSHMRTTYQGDGTWRMQSYLLRGLEGAQSEVVHRLLDVIGRTATTYKGVLNSSGRWRVDNGRLLLQDNDFPDSEEDLSGLTATRWTIKRGNSHDVYVKRRRWDNMTDAEILAYHGTITGALADPYEGAISVGIEDKAR